MLEATRHPVGSRRPSGAVPGTGRVAAVLLALVSVIAGSLVAGGARAGGAQAHQVSGPVLQWSLSIPDQPNSIAESSPNLADLDGQPSVVVGSRDGDVYAFHLSDGSTVAGWPFNTGAQVDSTPSVAPIGPFGLDDVFVGAGNAADSRYGGYVGISNSGGELWNRQVQNPASCDGQCGQAVQASLPVGNLGDGTDVAGGSLGQVAYALDAVNGGVRPGYPWLTADSVYSSAALADLYGDGNNEIVMGGDSTAGFADGVNYANGGHLRVLTGNGNLNCEYNPDQVVQSSPAVGQFQGTSGRIGIVFGTGTFWPGASDTDRLIAVDTDCNPLWSTVLPGATNSSPAIADVLGNGQDQIVEGSNINNSSGAVSVVDGSDGSVIWSAPTANPVIGSVVTADLTGDGYQDILVPTTFGVDVFDGRSGQEVTTLGENYGFQNSPLVTDDADGAIGVTLAGYYPSGSEVLHYEFPGSDGAAADEPGAWPMFHHDPQLTGTAGSPDPVSISGFSPSSGTIAGRQTVTITGSYLSNASSVDFGTTPATIVSDTASSITVLTPPAASAEAAFVSVTADGQTALAPEVYTYFVPPPPVITSVSPARGPTAGNTVVTITGANFESVGSVSFGRTRAPVFVDPDSGGELVVVTPAGSAGSADVTVATVGGTTVDTGGFTYVAPAPDPYTPVTPVRICDTRSGNPSGLTGTAAQCNGPSGAGDPLVASTESIDVAGYFGVPTDATAVFLNVTATDSLSSGYVTAFPTDQLPPTASSVNFPAGTTVPNLVEVAVGAGGQVSFTSNTAVDVVVDLEGYVAPGGTPGAGLYDALPAAARICDTRSGDPSGLSGPAAQCDGDRLVAGTPADVQVAGVGGVPASGVEAAVLNVTVVDPAAQGHLTVYPAGGSVPVSSNDNFAAGQTVADRVIVPVSATGAVDLVSSQASDVIVDVSGWYSSGGGTGGQYVALPGPVRVCDTRSGNPSGLSGVAAQCNGSGDAGSTLGPGGSLTVSVTGVGGVPAAVGGVVVNLTAVDPSGPTYLTVAPGTTRPAVSDLNAQVGSSRANLVVTAVSATGTVTVTNNSDTVDVIVDVDGYFPPPPTLTSITPDSGSVAGLTTVTITGTGLAGASAVAIGSSPVSVTSDTATTITGVAPAGPAGPADVSVTTAGGTGVDPGAYDYVVPPPPTISSVTPSEGPTAGQTIVTLAGTNLESATAVDVGGQAATVTSDPDGGDTLTLITPPGPAGPADVSVTTAGGTVDDASAFTYLAPVADPYTSVSPVRICDTRPGDPSGLSGTAAQCSGSGGSGDTLVPCTPVTLAVAGSFGVPADATAAVLNVTAVDGSGSGHVTVYPAGQVPPTASDLNFTVGRVTSNLVEAGLGAGGGLSVVASASVDVVVDLEGYVGPASASGAGLYNPLATPARICDTRSGDPSGLTGPADQCDGARLAAGTPSTVQVTGVGGVPSTGVSAVVVNLTVVGPAGPGHLTAYAAGTPEPTTSDVNFAAGQTVPNRVIVPVGASGQISLVSSQATNAIVDVSGWFSSAGGTGAQFTPEPAPVRICDTRPGNPSGLTGASAQCDGTADAGTTLGSGSTLVVDVTGLAGVPTGATAVVLNVTAVHPSAPTFLTVFPSGSPPLVSDLNPSPGAVEPNLVVATVSAGGTVSIFNNSGTVDVVVDVAGWYS